MSLLIRQLRACWIQVALPTVPRWLATVTAAGCLLVLLYVGIELRLNRMVPGSEALLYQADYDEGVHIAAAQLTLQGYAPYDDFLFLQPPFGVWLYASVLRLHFVPWGDATAFVLGRYTAIACGIVTLLAVFALGRRLGGLPSGLLSAGLLAIDAVVIETDRRALLEAPVNALSALAILCFLVALDRGRRRYWLMGAGVLGALAMLTKTAGAAVLLALALYAAGRVAAAVLGRFIPVVRLPSGDSVKSRLSDLGTVCAAAGLTVVLIAGYFLATNLVSFLQQVYIFHLVRPADGVIGTYERLTSILGNEGSHLTVYLALAGFVVIIFRGLVLGNWGRWHLIVVWAAGILALFASARTLFPHYYSQLAVPLAVLGGGLVSRNLGRHAGATGNSPGRWRPAAVRGGQIALTVLVLLTNAQAGATQCGRARAVADQRSVNLRDVARYLAENTPPTSTVLGFQAMYALTGSRAPAGPAAGQFLIDSYGAMLFENLGLNESVIPEPSEREIWDAMHDGAGQKAMLDLASRADYIVIDRQARWELNPEIITAMTADRTQVFESGKVAVYARR